MLRTIEAKLCLKPAQAETLSAWMRSCCWVYNRALEHRIKAYKRRKESITYNNQCKMLTSWRERIPRIESVPVQFTRDAIRRVDRGMQAFFRRVKAGQKPGFPRFRSYKRYNSLECLVTHKYIRQGDYINIPKLGLAKFRAGNQSFVGTQKLLRILRRADGWYAQVLVDDGKPLPETVPVQSSVGIDVGLTTFAALSTGEKIENPRWARKSQRKLCSAQRRLSRCQKHSRNRRKAVVRVKRVHQKVSAQRKDYAHQHSRKLVNKYDLIGFEKLNIKGLARTRLAKSIMDVGWGIFLRQLTYKAAYAGRQTIAVDPRGTSQECPNCGQLKKKKLSERVHVCSCGLVCDRDYAAARVVLSRALESSRGVTPAEEPTAGGGKIFHCQVGPTKQEVLRNRDTTPYFKLDSM